LDDVGAVRSVSVLYRPVETWPGGRSLRACAFARGLVFALPGNGSVPQRLAPALEACRRQGVTVVRASRTGAGPVAPLSDALAGPLLCAGQLSPAKARIALMLALAQGRLELFEEIAA